MAEPQWRNPVRARLEAGEPVLGLTVTTSTRSGGPWRNPGLRFPVGGDGALADHTGDAAQHGAGDSRAAGSVFARVPVNELWTAKRVLDQGVSGVIFPFASTPELAEHAAQACRYPPLGTARVGRRAWRQTRGRSPTGITIRRTRT